jgi:hypothetical protein
MVHAYLMYGFPTQTVQETVDSLEMVRQLFELGTIKSGFWHQFALTTHSPIGLNPTEYGIFPDYKEITFANNDIQFKDKTQIDHDKFSFGLKKSIFNFMHGVGFDLPLQDWFDFKIPRTSIKSHFMRECVESEPYFMVKLSAKIIWLGGTPLVSEQTKSKKGKSKQLLQLTFHDKSDSFQVQMENESGVWFLNMLERLSVHNNEQLTFGQLKTDYETHFGDFELFWYSKPINSLRAHGLLVL